MTPSCGEQERDRECELAVLAIALLQQGARSREAVEICKVHNLSASFASIYYFSQHLSEISRAGFRRSSTIECGGIFV